MSAETASAAAVLQTLEKLGPLATQAGLLTREQLRETQRALRKAMCAPEPAAPVRGLPVREVADRLGMSRKTVHRMIAAGSLPAVRVTGSRKSLRVPESAVNALLSSVEG